MTVDGWATIEGNVQWMIGEAEYEAIVETALLSSMSKGHVTAYLFDRP
jgi:hypothetical protein